MQIIFTPRTMREHFDELAKKMKEVRHARLIHTIFPCIFSLILTPTISSFIDSPFLRLLFAIPFASFFCLLLPRILRLSLLSCQHTPFPTPKLFFFYALQNTEKPEVIAENRRGKYVVSISFENKEGGREEKNFIMEGKKKEGIKEEIVDFDEDVVWVPKKKK